ncbi:ComF family protein [Sporosarcina sp. HYO08]|uniref:ComF family protein n=1 Tax=Sporosarcina sp. HYO08 TaxID=1759557 RepID=UPI0009E6D243|nr:phosphoribosyltransferase family protein [Sporosarcina sp. HYO08]
MNECLLCAQPMRSSPSWRALLGIDENSKICLDCSKMFERADIVEEGASLNRITSVFTYNEAMREFLHQYKFLQDVALADVFSKELRSYLRKEGTIVPIPMHLEKKRERTFAHVDELLKSAGISYSHLLEKTGTEVMGEKTKEQRLSMAPLFRLKENIEKIDGIYILVDDIYTTGTTLRHAAALLKEAGATRVEAVTLIRA